MSLVVVRCSLFGGCGLVLFVVCWWSFDVCRWIMSVVHCLLFYDCWLFVDCLFGWVDVR